MKSALIGTPGIPVAYSQFETAGASPAACTTNHGGPGYSTPSLASRT